MSVAHVLAVIDGFFTRSDLKYVFLLYFQYLRTSFEISGGVWSLLMLSCVIAFPPNIRSCGKQNSNVTNYHGIF